jgi:hypothetical protein
MTDYIYPLEILSEDLLAEFPRVRRDVLRVTVTCARVGRDQNLSVWASLWLFFEGKDRETMIPSRTGITLRSEEELDAAITGFLLARKRMRELRLEVPNPHVGEVVEAPEESPA